MLTQNVQSNFHFHSTNITLTLSVPYQRMFTRGQLSSNVFR